VGDIMRDGPVKRLGKRELLPSEQRRLSQKGPFMQRQVAKIETFNATDA
jgi:hypothetical protein